MILKNNIIILEAEINDKILGQIRELKDSHPEKLEVIAACVAMIHKDFPEIEIFEVGSNYIVTESRMYIALFEDEIEMS
jgi:hypothetical protein